jgi:hypothetical protein
VPAPEPAIAIVFVHLGPDPGAGSHRIAVPEGTPAGGIWGHLPGPVRAAGPPEGVRYLLNGLRTIPGAPLRDGDRLEIAPPSHEEPHRHAPSR